MLQYCTHFWNIYPLIIYIIRHISYYFVIHLPVICSGRIELRVENLIFSKSHNNGNFVHPQIALAIVWLCSGVYCSPKLIFFKAVEHKLENNEIEVICLADRKLYNSKVYDTINFFLLYLIPLSLISAFYFKIARYLWVNGSFIESRLRQDLVGNSTPSHTQSLPCGVSDRWTEQRRCLQQVHKEQQEYENRPLNVRITGSNSSSSRYSFRSDRIDNKRSEKMLTLSLMLRMCHLKIPWMTMWILLLVVMNWPHHCLCWMMMTWLCDGRWVDLRLYPQHQR